MFKTRRVDMEGNNGKLLLSLFISVILTLLIGREVILSPGYIVLLEQFEVYTLQNFIKYTYPAWNEQIQAFNLGGIPKIYLYGFISLIGKVMGNSYKVVQILLLLLPYPIAFLSMQKLSEHVTSKSLKTNLTNAIFIFSLIAAFVYTINPWFANNPRNVIFRVEYAFLPLITLLFILMLEKDRSLKYVLLFAFTLAFIAGYRYLAIVAPMLILIFLIFNFLKENRWRAFIINTKKLLLLGIIFLLISAGKFLAPILYSKSVTLRAVSEFTTKNIQREQMLHIFSTKIYQWPASNYDLTYQDASHFLFILIVIFAFTYLLFIGKKYRPGQNFFYLILFPSIFILFALFSAKELNLDPFLLKLPFSDFIGRLLRHARWNVMPIILSISVMVGLSLSYLHEYLGRNKKLIVAILSIAIILLSSVSAWPMLTGDMNGYWRPSQIPCDYITVNQIIEDEGGDFHVLWFPSSHNRRAIWSNATGISEITAPMGLFSIRSSSKPSYSTKKAKVYFFDFFNPVGTYHRIFDEYKGKNLSSIYLPLNVKYLVICYDANWTEREKNRGFTNEKIKSVAERLKESGSFDVIYEGDYLTAFKLNNCEQKVFTAKQPLFVSGGLKAYGSLNSPDISTKDYAVIFSDRKFNKKLPICQRPIFLTVDNTFVPGIFLQDTKRLEILPAARAPIDVAPRDAWVYSYGVKGPDFQKSLLQNDIKSWGWDFDYGKGLVFTWSPSVLEAPSALKEENLLAKFDFEDDLGEWQINAKNLQNMSLSNLAHQGKHSLGVELYNSTQSGKVISSPLVTAKYGSQYRWEFYVKGEDAHNVHAWISEHDASGNRIMSYHMKEIGNGNFNWKKVSFDFSVDFEDTTYLQLNIVHGSETDKPLPNKIWVDDVSVYDLRDYLKPNTLEIPFNVDKTDNYKLFIRYFKNQKGGEIKVHLDSERITINTKDQLNRFIWKDLGTYQLVNGGHTLVLENVKGFNAVNLFALIPEEDHRNFKQEMTEVMQNKTMIYLFEAESDMYSDNANISKKFGGEASNGEVLEIADGKAWQEIELIKDGTYRLAIRAKGDFRVQIADKEFESHNSNLTYWYSPTFELNRGEYNLTIRPLDISVANFSFEPVSNIETEIIERLPAGIVSFSTDSYSGLGSLEINSNVSEGGWLWFSTPEVNVTPRKRYSAITHMKYKNVVESHITIEGYNKTAGEWIELMQVPSGQTGTSDWKEYRQMLTIPEDITKIRFVLNAGWINDQEVGNATTWFDDISVYPVKDYLDVIWLYTTRNNETINELFKTNETPASIMEYTKIDPTKYEVKVNATEPFMLSFAEGYDPLWEARIYKDGEKVEVVKSIPLYSVINGFWVDETGDLEIEIRYKPQEWFELGLWVSVTTFIGCIGYLFYDWRRGKGGKWALRIGAMWHNTGNVVNKGFREGVQRLKKKQKRKN
jgi:hypothetical protein